MEEREFDFDEPIIYCAHNFDISDRKNFANELATRLNVNINITQGGNEVIDTIKIPNATITKNLYCQNPKFDKDFKYVLEHGDEAHLFSANYLRYILPCIMDYQIVIDDLKNQSESDNENEFKSIDQLKMFGATEVHINNLEEVHLTDEDKKDWSTVLNVINNLENHFIYKLV